MKTLATLSLWTVLALVPLTGFAQKETRDALLQVERTIDAYLALPGPVDRSPSQTSQATTLIATLSAFDPHIARPAVINRIAGTRSGKSLVKFRFLLEHMTPSLREQFLLRAASEGNPRQKRNFIRLAEAFWTDDTVKFLVSQLEDKSPADTEGEPSPNAVRICDYALNVLYKNLRTDLGLRIGVGTGDGDAIVPDVAIAKREEWIGALKTALVAKYGTDLNVPEKK